MTTYPTASNVTSFVNIFKYGNMVSGDIMGILILIMTFSISFIAMRAGQSEVPGVNAKIFLASSFITMVLSAFLMIMSVVNDLTMYFCIVLVAVGTFANLVAGSK